MLLNKCIKILLTQLVIEKTCDELVLIDRNEDMAWAEVTASNHLLCYTEWKMRVSQGATKDCSDADIVVLSVAGRNEEGMTVLDMTESAGAIVKNIVPEIMKSGFDGIFVVITNPVDVMTYLVQKLSGLPANRVIGKNVTYFR
ncbi:MAG: hypothetical protein ACERKZ_06305 [Lachnotalea sp.]